MSECHLFLQLITILDLYQIKRIQSVEFFKLQGADLKGAAREWLSRGPPDYWGKGEVKP